MRAIILIALAGSVLIAACGANVTVDNGTGGGTRGSSPQGTCTDPFSWGPITSYVLSGNATQDTKGLQQECLSWTNVAHKANSVCPQETTHFEGQV